MRRLASPLIAALICLAMTNMVHGAPAYADKVKRTASGKPDLSGVYDTGTLTPTHHHNSPIPKQ